MSRQIGQSPKYLLLTSPAMKNYHNSNKVGSYSSPKPLNRQLQTAKLTKNSSSRGLKFIFQKDMQLIKGQLNQCIVSTNYEEQRNNSLKILIGILNSEMTEMVKDQKRGREMQLQANDKKAKKIEYDMEQIMQKQNQEIAKINCLKEQSASARSDRVVFSNLFKKIENEIKQHEDLYKETIIKTQIMRQAKNKKREEEASLEAKDEADNKDQNILINTHDKNTPEPQNDDRIFITNPKQKNSHHMTNTSKHSEKQTYHRNSHKEEDIDLQVDIQQKQNHIEKILKLAECNSFDQAVTHYSSLQSKNSQIIQQIEGQNMRIDQLERQIQKFKIDQCINQLQYDRELKKIESRPSISKLMSHSLIQTPPTQHHQIEKDATARDILYEVIKLLDLPSSRQELIDFQSEQLINQLEVSLNKLALQKGNHLNQESVHNGENLQSIISKMQRYDSCQRLFSKKQFVSQYIRQTCKTKKLPRTKK